MIKNTFIYSVAFLAMFTISALAFAQDFIEDMSDIPLMLGLEIIHEAGFTFEQENGRIVEKLAVGTISESAISSFYNESLPALGWTQIDTNAFKRDNENFSYALRLENGTSIITFKLFPVAP